MGLCSGLVNVCACMCVVGKGDVSFMVVSVSTYIWSISTSIRKVATCMNASAQHAACVKASGNHVRAHVAQNIHNTHTTHTHTTHNTPQPTAHIHTHAHAHTHTHTHTHTHSHSFNVSPSVGDTLRVQVSPSLRHKSASSVW